MKRTIIKAGMSFLIAIAVAGSLNAQPGMGRMMMQQDTARMRRMEHMRMRGSVPGSDSLRMRMMMRHGGAMNGGQMWRGMGPGYGPGMRGQMGYGRMHNFRGNREFGRNQMAPWRQDFRKGIPGMRILEMLPDLTDKQRQDILKIRQQEEQEMLKIRQDMQTKVQALRQSQKAKIMSLLTDKQKKFLEDNRPGAQVQKPAESK